jgi:hypothetical protein
MPKVPKTNIGYKLNKSFDHQSVGSPGLHSLISAKGYIKSIFFPGDILPSGTQLVGNNVYIDFRVSLIQGRDKSGNKSVAHGEILDVEWNNILEKNSRSENPTVFLLTSTPQELFTSFGSKQTIERIQPVIEYTFHPTTFLYGTATIISDSRFGNGGEISPEQWSYTQNKNRSGNAIQIFSAMLNNTKIPGF